MLHSSIQLKATLRLSLKAQIHPLSNSPSEDSSPGRIRLRFKETVYKLSTSVKASSKHRWFKTSKTHPK